jgi:hypothetical protein
MVIAVEPPCLSRSSARPPGSARIAFRAAGPRRKPSCRDWGCEKLAAAGAAGGSAKADVAKANAEIIEARKQTVRLKKEAADANLQQERIKAAPAWRTLTPETASQLIERLSKDPCHINIRYTDGGPEAMYFAIQLHNAFSAVKTNCGARTLKSSLLFDILIPGSMQTIIDAFVTAQLSFSVGELLARERFEIGIFECFRLLVRQEILTALRRMAAPTPSLMSGPYQDLQCELSSIPGPKVPDVS